jgi:hypothetical protein
LGPNFSTKIQFLKGVDSGCCFVEMSSEADIEKALLKNGEKIHDCPIFVQRSNKGILTSETGQKFALNINTVRNASQISLDKPINKKKLVKTNELSPTAPEFYPTISQYTNMSKKKVQNLHYLIHRMMILLLPYKMRKNII